MIIVFFVEALGSERHNGHNTNERVSDRLFLLLPA